MGVLTKNLLISSSSETIRSFKEIGMKFFRDHEKIYLFSYKTFLMNILLNMEREYKEKYKMIVEPPAEYLDFYKRKGSPIDKQKVYTKANIGFTLDSKYYHLYYSLMHTYYVNECQDLPNYSVSIFFKEIVKFFLENPQDILIDTN